MSPIAPASPNAALKFARWLATQPLGQGTNVSPRRPAWIQGTRPRIKALIEKRPAA